jgi:predicted dehydrogenase
MFQASDYREGLGRRTFIKGISAAGLGLAVSRLTMGLASAAESQTPAPASSKRVKVGIVGVGGRGNDLLNILLSLSNNEVRAVCDIVPERAASAADKITKAGFPEPKLYMKGERDFERMCETEELDIVITATPVDWHVPVCVAAMKNGKHAATEVHATYLLDECWELVETAEKYKRQCAILENYCYFYNVLMVLKMVRSGLLGDLVHCESGYQHDVRYARFGSDGALLWRAKDMLTHNGNLYPTHAVGPVAQWMNINRGDRFDYLVSMSSKSSGMKVYAEQHFGKDHESTKHNYMQGDVNCTLIRTVNGLTITLYYDAQLPRPFDMIYRAQGTKGIYLGTLDKLYIEGKSRNDQWEPSSKYADQYEHPLWKELGKKATSYGHGGADYMMIYRLIDAIQKGGTVDMDVYDAASWSAISPLSEKSVANKSQAVDFPDFTRGKWKTNQPLGIVGA